jgi:transaldolase
MTDRLQQLTDAGVSIWLDDLSRERLETGNLADLLKNSHVVGVTSNPSIFQSALKEGERYDPQIRELASQGADTDQAVRTITTDDVREACKVMRPAYDASDTVDGRVSIEVSPGLAHDTEATVKEAAELWETVGEPNLYIKIPGTKEGWPAITETLANGIPVNVTLIFGLDQYQHVMEAFVAGLEKARDNGHDLSQVQSVASFFVSRVDTEIDSRLDKIGTTDAAALRGEAAIANARLAYQHYERVFSSARWAALQAAGARPQRPLWASTSVKDPAYPDTRYVTSLVAPGVINTMPEATLRAVADHGRVPADSIHGHYDEARQVLDRLRAVGIDLDEVMQGLEDSAVSKFDASWDQLGEQLAASLHGRAAQAQQQGS